MAAGQRIGYIRVSSGDQNPDRQLADQRDRLDKVFIDHASGRTIHRPQWQALRQYVREGDTVVVHSIDRLARNLDDLRRIVKDLTEEGVTIEFLKEAMHFVPQGQASAMDQLQFTILGAFAEFEVNLLHERQAEGIALAKQRGVYTGGHVKLTRAQITEMQALLAEGKSKSAIARHFGIHRATIYRYLEQQTQSHNPGA